MTTSTFSNLEAVIQSDVFPDVDIALRRGRHIGRDDGPLYELVLEAFALLHPFYVRFGCDLVHQSDGYFYLRPTSERLGRRHLSVGEMLVGQMCALMYLDPASLQTTGVVKREAILQRLSGLIGNDGLVKALNPLRKKHIERVSEEKVRNQVADALRKLEDLGFVDLLDHDDVRLRSALMRFVEPVRGTADLADALQQLVARGEVVLGKEDGPDDDDGDAVAEEPA